VSGGCECRSTPPAGGANSSHRLTNPSAKFQGPLRGGGKRGRRIEGSDNERKERGRNDGKNSRNKSVVTALMISVSREA